MPKVSVAVNQSGNVFGIFSGSADDFVSEWRAGKQSATLTEPKEFSRVSAGFLMSSEEKLMVHTAEVPNDDDETRQAYDRGYTDGEGKYILRTGGQSLLIKEAQNALSSVQDHPDSFLCMLLATCGSWRFHPASFCNIDRWLSQYRCPEPLRCVLGDLRRAMGQAPLAEGLTAEEAVVASLDVQASLPALNKRARDTSATSANTVLSALLANGHVLPKGLPEATIPPEMRPAFLFLDGQASEYDDHSETSSP